MHKNNCTMCSNVSLFAGLARSTDITTKTMKRSYHNKMLGDDSVSEPFNETLVLIVLVSYSP